jgi:release factor glutamine methyltransferase
MTITEALSAAQTLGVDRLEAQLMLLHALGKSRTARGWLLAHDLDALSVSTEAAFLALVQRRVASEPLAYLTGRVEFFGLELTVDPRVLVPRPDTETLVGWALELAPLTGHMMDLGTGSGAVALALKHARPDLHVSAVDFSADALTVAQANAQRLHLEVTFIQSSWLEQAAGQFDAIVSNPPYIALHDGHLAALIHEPQQALVSGKDGLDDIRQIITQAPAHLHAGGWLLLEHGYDQAERVRSLLMQTGFRSVQSRRDLSGVERCSGGKKV